MQTLKKDPNKIKEWAKQQRQLLRRNPGKYINSRGNKLHIDLSHRYVSNTEMLNNVISGAKYADGRFTDERVMYDAVGQALDDNMHEIGDFLYNRPNESSLYIEYGMDDYDDVIGTGFTNTNKHRPIDNERTIQTVSTKCVAVILERDKENPRYFFITTAYPVTNPRNPENKNNPDLIQYENKDLSNILKNTQAYKIKDDIWRLAARKACNDKSLNDIHINYQSAEETASIYTDTQPGITAELSYNRASGRLQMTCANVKRLPPRDPPYDKSIKLVHRTEIPIKAAKTLAPETIQAAEQQMADMRQEKTAKPSIYSQKIKKENQRNPPPETPAKTADTEYH